MSAADPLSASPVIPASALRIAPYWLLALAVFAAYGNVYDNAFLFDDDLLIRLNGDLRGWGHIGHILSGSTTSGAMIAGGFYRPLQMLLYMIVFNLGDGTVVLFHLLNISLHAANACLMHRLGIRLGFDRAGVFVAALIWALHPLHTEAVTYISATADPLFAFFCLWAIVVLLPDLSARKIWRIIPLFLLGLASKETTVMLPLLVMSCIFLTDPRRARVGTYLRTWPLWIISLIYALWRMQDTNLDGPGRYARLYAVPEFSTLRLYADHPLDRIYTFFATLPAYLKLLVWPTGLHMERSFQVFTRFTDAPVLIGVALCVLSGILIVYAARNGRFLALGWGLLWFAAAHAPDTGIAIPMNSLFLEHWMYLPTVGLLLGVAENASQALQKCPRAVSTGCGVAALVFAALMSQKTYAQNAVWHDPGSFYTNIFAYGEESARARNNLALYYSDRGDYAEAIEQFKKAILLTDSYAETRHNLALTYLRMSNAPENIQMAIDNLQRALAIDPNFYRSAQALAALYANQGDTDKATYYQGRVADILRQRR